MSNRQKVLLKQIEAITDAYENCDEDGISEELLRINVLNLVREMMEKYFESNR